MFIYMGSAMPLYGFALFLPSVISDLGPYSTTKAQLLTVPPYALAAALTIVVGFIADRTRQRGLCNIAVSFLGITGFAMLLGSDKASVKYAGTYLGALGIYPAISNSISWTLNNIEGVYKRGVVLGCMIGWGNLNGVVSSNIFFKSPKYRVGHAVIMGYLIICLLGGSLLQRWLLSRENKLRKEGKRDGWTLGLTEAQRHELGDKRPDFYHTL